MNNELVKGLHRRSADQRIFCRTFSGEISPKAQWIIWKITTLYRVVEVVIVINEEETFVVVPAADIVCWSGCFIECGLKVGKKINFLPLLCTN